MVLCEWCDKAIKKEWAKRIAASGTRNHRGPLYFCNDDHRENWREHHASGDEYTYDHVKEQTAGTGTAQEYGDWSES